MAVSENKDSEEVKGKHAKALDMSGVGASSMGAFAPAGNAMPEVPAPKKESMALRVAGIVGGVILTLLIVVYGLGVFYFQDRFFPNTMLGDKDISLKATSDLDRMVRTSVGDYSLKISGDGFSQEIKAHDVNLHVDIEDTNAQILAGRNLWAWPVEVFLSHDVSGFVRATYDAAALEGVMKPAIEVHNETSTATQDATIVYDASLNAFSVKAEEYGTELVEEPVMKAVEGALVNLEPTLELGREMVVQPAILSDDPRLAEAAVQATEMVKADITLMLGESQAGHVTSEISSQWVTLDDEFHLALDEEAMGAWVDDIAHTFDTLGTERTYTRPDGKVCVVSGGDYGWKVDHEGLIEMVSDDMAQGLTIVEDVPTTSRAKAFNGAGQPDWGSRFVDVDIEEQHARFYDGGEIIWESDFVSGSMKDNRITPLGAYDLNDKKSPSTLIGYKPNGEKDYETPVKYWMPFVKNSVGFHDASWQSGFGGTRYLEGYASHGCINLPPDAAQQLYDLIELNEVILVHW